MQRRTKLAGLVAASLIAGTAAASAQGYDWSGNPASGPTYGPAHPRAMYYPGPVGPYGTLNGSNHPAPSSTQGDVGPDGNNNGTRTGIYRQW